MTTKARLMESIKDPLDDVMLFEWLIRCSPKNHEKWIRRMENIYFERMDELLR